MLGLSSTIISWVFFLLIIAFNVQFGSLHILQRLLILIFSALMSSYDFPGKGSSLTHFHLFAFFPKDLIFTYA